MSKFNVKQWAIFLCEEFWRKGVSILIASDDSVDNITCVHITYKERYLGFYELVATKQTKLDANIEVYFDYAEEVRFSILCFGVKSQLAFWYIFSHLDNLLKEVNNIK